jgi:hypothetical protein
MDGLEVWLANEDANLPNLKIAFVDMKIPTKTVPSRPKTPLCVLCALCDFVVVRRPFGC